MNTELGLLKFRSSDACLLKLGTSRVSHQSESEIKASE